MLLQPPTLLAMTLAAIIIATLVATFFMYATGEGPGS